MIHASLFSGQGGFDLAAELMKWKNAFHCENNSFCQKILKYHFPNAKSYEDITKTDFSIWRGRIDVLTGGFPCQPYSISGLRKGTADERHLWPAMLRAIKQIKPRWVVCENVYGLVNWNNGLVFQQVQTDLENEGYSVQTYLLPAAGINAPHERKRIWFVAYSNSYDARRYRYAKIGQSQSSGENQKKKREWLWSIFERISRKRNAPNSHGFRLRRQSNWPGETKLNGEVDKECNWGNFPTQSPICNGNDGISSKLDGITFPKWRSESIKAGGNAIVPGLALQIFRTIERFENPN